MKLIKEFWIKWKMLLTFLAVPFFLWLAQTSVTPKAQPGNLAEHGQYGDSFGSLNVLFSGLAFAVLFCALLYQREELELQREELRNTRSEIQKSGQAQEQSAAALQLQAKMLYQTAKLTALTTRIKGAEEELDLKRVELDNIPSFIYGPKGSTEELEATRMKVHAQYVERKAECKRLQAELRELLESMIS